jgi:hypothetical protein
VTAAVTIDAPDDRTDHISETRTNIIKAHSAPATEVKWPGLRAVEGETGLGEKSVGEFGSVLDAFEPVADDPVQVIKGAIGPPRLAERGSPLG